MLSELAFFRADKEERDEDVADLTVVSLAVADAFDISFSTSRLKAFRSAFAYFTCATTASIFASFSFMSCATTASIFASFSFMSCATISISLISAVFFPSWTPDAPILFKNICLRPNCFKIMQDKNENVTRNNTFRHV